MFGAPWIWNFRAPISSPITHQAWTRRSVSRSTSGRKFLVRILFELLNPQADVIELASAQFLTGNLEHSAGAFLLPNMRFDFLHEAGHPVIEPFIVDFEVEHFRQEFPDLLVFAHRLF